MALETATYISDLVSTNPTASDNISQGDDHIRLLKATVKATFPNVTGAVTATHTELNILDGVTASTAELNILDGLTASTAELNILDGLTASTVELNYVDGVTSAIQTQLDSKVTSAGTSTLTNKTINGADNTLTVRLANDVSGTLPVANGGTGATSLTANNVLLGNGTSAVQSVAPGTSGNVLTSNGSTWVSDTPPAPASLSTASGSAPSYSARAWVNFNGTGTVTIRSSGNVSSITDHSAGDYTVNFTTAMPDVNYATNATGDGPINNYHCIPFVASGSIRSTYSTSAVAVQWFNQNQSGTRADPTIASVVVFR